jgi:hypothetical protein
MLFSAAVVAGKLWPDGGGFQFSFCIGWIQILNWRRRRSPRIWLDNEHRAAMNAVAKGRPARRLSCQSGRPMKQITEQNIAVSAGIAVLCALALLSLGFSPALATTLSRGTDFNTTFTVVRSMVYPLCAIIIAGCRRSAPARARRWIESFPYLDCWKEAA